MNELYKSPYEAYPFLSDPAEDLRCDFEILTDKAASLTGLLRACVEDTTLKTELLKVCELIYHANPSLRTRVTITREEVAWLESCTRRLREETAARCEKFVLTQGSPRGCVAHLLRVSGKELVRLLYHWDQAGHPVDPLLYDFINLLSGYFFGLALKLNELDGVEEIPFVSRNYR